MLGDDNNTEVSGLGNIPGVCVCVCLLVWAKKRRRKRG